MLRVAFYPIIRTFTSTAIGLAVLTYCLTAHAASAGDIASVVFEDAKEKSLSLPDFKGKPLVLNLWATWCGPCKEEMPSLAKLQKDYKANGLLVLAVSEDDTLYEAVDYFRNPQFSALSVYFDTHHEMMRALPARGVPTSVLINRKGEIVKILEGSINWQSPEITKDIDELVAKN